MGKKQIALVIEVSNRENACHGFITEIKTACDQVLALNQKILANKDPATHKKLLLDKNTPYGTLIKARAKLSPLIDSYNQSVASFEKFVTEKSKRWVGKSTLGQAQHFLKDTKDVQKDYHDLIAFSKSL